jgi:hypothetical protein
VHALCFPRRNLTFGYFAHVIVNILLLLIPTLVLSLSIFCNFVMLDGGFNHSSFGFMIMLVMDASTSRWIFPLMMFIFSSLIHVNLSLLYVSVIVISFCWVRHLTHLRLLSIFRQLTLSCPCVFCCFLVVPFITLLMLIPEAVQ